MRVSVRIRATNGAKDPMACLVMSLYVQITFPISKRVTHGRATTVNVPGRDRASGGRAGRSGGHPAGGRPIPPPALPLRYQIGSGPFGTRTLQVSLRAGQQPVTAEPWAAEVPPS